MVKIAVNGALGRMGSSILRLAYAAKKEFKVVGAFDQSKALAPDDLKDCQVLIDFSSPEGVRRSLKAALKARTALVIGTTGMPADLERALRGASKNIPVLFAPNMSLGANFLFELASLAAKRLSDVYDIEIVEAHHRLKKDAPSGTAKKLAETIAQAKGWNTKDCLKYGRQGFTGERSSKEIGIHVVRAGEIVGEHSAIFSGPGETLEITHKAQSRDAFAQGALKAALYLSKKKKGLYSMADVLEDKL